MRFTVWVLGLELLGIEVLTDQPADEEPQGQSELGHYPRVTDGPTGLGFVLPSTSYDDD